MNRGYNRYAESRKEVLSRRSHAKALKHVTKDYRPSQISGMRIEIFRLQLPGCNFCIQDEVAPQVETEVTF